MRLIDLRYQGIRRAIAAWIVDDEILVDPGPEATIDTLLDAVDGWQPRAIALTHIHLDHAGATGALLERWPDCEVWVHERGAPHLVSPERLLASARRVYAEHLEELWGGTAPVPATAIRPLRDGDVAGPFDVLETPGHASHHLAYLHRPSHTAFAGDTAGVRMPGAELVLAPTVPPEFDPISWSASIERIARRQPTHLALPHFGEHSDVSAHLRGAQASVQRWAQAGRELDEAAFTNAIRDTIAAAGDAAVQAAYRAASQPRVLWSGASRYWGRAEPGLSHRETDHAAAQRNSTRR